LLLCFTLVTYGSFISSLILNGSPMYSSSAYPTTIPSSELVTSVHAAIDPRSGTRAQDTSGGFPVGLIPQLIDVLHILTEGQDLLSRKIRSARHDESSRSIPIDEQLECFQIPAGQPVVGDGSPAVETPRIPSSGDIEFDGQTTRANTLGINCPSVPGVEAGEADTSPVSVLDSAPASDSPVVASADVMGEPSSGSLARSVLVDSAAPAETTPSPLRRDYNFFDELDARLASLQNPRD
jgi:hypothetical protein